MDTDPGDLEVGLEEAERPGRAPWSALFSFTTKLHALPLSLALFTSAASGIIIPALAFFLGKIFDQFSSFGALHVSSAHFVEKVARYSIWLCGLGVASGFLNGAFYSSWLAFGESQARIAREQIFEDVLDKDMEWFDLQRSGQIADLQLAVSQPLGFAIQCSVTALTSLILSFYYAWSLTLVTLAFVPFSAIILAFISARMQPSVDAQAQTLTEACKVTTCAISSIDTVKCLNAQNLELWQYATKIRRAADAYLAQARANAMQIGIVRCVTLCMFVQGFWYGSHLVRTKEKTSGDLVTAFMSALTAAQSVEQVLPQLLVLEKGRAAGSALKATQLQIEKGRRIGRMMGGHKPAAVRGDIEMSHVSFSYSSRPNRLVLDDININFAANRTTFLVGSSGSGKSSIANLLLGLYRPVTGLVMLDGHPLQVLDSNWLRKNVGLCQQQSTLFNETLLKNLSFGQPGDGKVGKLSLEKAIDIAHLSNIVRELPQGLHSLVGVGGTTLSGGQNQRVAIARARVRDAPVLILDECTSALDHMSKVLVFEAIREWRRDKTTIIITHDMEQIRDSDYVYVLDHGRIKQQGFASEIRSGPHGALAAASPFALDFPKSPKEQDILIPSKRLSTEITHPCSPTKRFSFDGTCSKSRRRSSRGLRLSFSSNVNDWLRGSALASPLSPVAFPIHLASRASPTFERADSPKYDNNIAEIIEMYNYETSDGKHGLQRQYFASAEDSRPELVELNDMKERRWSIASTLVAVPTKQDDANKTFSQNTSLSSILSTVYPSLSRKRRALLLLGFLSATVHAAATPVFSWAFARLLGSIIIGQSRRNPGEARKWSMVVLAITLTDTIASYLMHYLLEMCGQSWVDAMRITAMESILSQPRAWFELGHNNIVHLNECLDRYAEEMRNLLGRFTGFAYVALVLLVLSVCWSMVLSWRFTLVGLASAPVMYLITRTFEAVSAKWEQKSQLAAAQIGKVFTETFVNVRTVRCFTLEAYFLKKCMKMTRRTFHVGMKRAGVCGIFFGLSDAANLFVTALIMWYGAKLASVHLESLQDILTALCQLLFGISNINAAVAFIPQVSSSRANATQLLRLARLPKGNSHEHTGHARIGELGTIRFESVSLFYPSRPMLPALTSLSLELQQGRTTALVGYSGSGKSSAASLLMGIYPPSSGSITIDHVPLRNIHLQTLRSLIAIVPQQPTIFPATIAENIAYALPERSTLSSLANVRMAAKTAGIADFIRGLPQGYNTLIGPGGTGLSGGQQQRIAISRAVARRPKLLILDEATSGLDQQTAEYVKNLVKRMEGKGVGVLFITHDKRMMEVCQEVAVMKDGRVVEQGSYADLRARHGSELRRLLGR